MIKRNKTDTVVIHCADTPEDMDIGAEKIREWHTKERGWDDIGYHWVIRRDGTLDPGRPIDCLLYTSPSPRDRQKSRMPSSA